LDNDLSPFAIEPPPRQGVETQTVKLLTNKGKWGRLAKKMKKVGEWRRKGEKLGKKNEEELDNLEKLLFDRNPRKERSSLIGDCPDVGCR
jgi:hypothetical protein